VDSASLAKVLSERRKPSPAMLAELQMVLAQDL